jgi:hypothetical protein
MIGGAQSMGRLARLTQAQLEEIRKFEERWNSIVLLAYQKPGEPAKLSPAQLKKVHALERELGVKLVAYR